MSSDVFVHQMLIASSNRHTVFGVSHRSYPQIRHSISKWSSSKSKVLSLKLLNLSRLGSEKRDFPVSIVLSLCFSQHSILYAFFARSSRMRLLIVLVPLSVASHYLMYLSASTISATAVDHRLRNFAWQVPTASSSALLAHLCMPINTYLWRGDVQRGDLRNWRKYLFELDHYASVAIFELTLLSVIYMFS